MPVKLHNELLIIKQYLIAFKLDDKTILGFDLENGNIIPKTQRIITSVSPEIATQIKDHFQINLEEYGVKIVDEVIDIMPSNITRNTHG